MRWFIADLHIDHAKVLIGSRGDAFETIEEWQDVILANINSRVEKNDQLFLLGDFAFKNIQKWRQRLRQGDIWLIRGNHDPSYDRCVEAFGKRNVRETFMTKLGDTPCWLSHYAHAFWPSSHRGAYHLYGHTHGMREETLNTWMPGRRSMDVCPETIFDATARWGPINEWQILDYLRGRDGHDQVQFYKDERGEY